MGQKPQNEKQSQAFIASWSELAKKPMCRKCGAPTLEGMDVCALFPKCKHRSKRRVIGEAIFGKQGDKTK